jgi:hypothetical protein
LERLDGVENEDGTEGRVVKVVMASDVFPMDKVKQETTEMGGNKNTNSRNDNEKDDVPNVENPMSEIPQETKAFGKQNESIWKAKRKKNESIAKDTDPNSTYSASAGEKKETSKSLVVDDSVTKSVTSALSDRQIFVKKSPQCKLCRNDILFAEIGELKWRRPSATNNDIVKTINDKYIGNPEFMINRQQLAVHFKFHFVVRMPRFENALAMNKNSNIIPAELMDEEEINELLNKDFKDLDFVRKQRFILAIKSRRLHTVIELMERIEQQSYDMQNVDNIPDGTPIFLNLPKEWLILNNLSESIENSIIDTFEKLQKNVRGHSIDFGRMQNYLLLLSEAMDKLANKLSYDENAKKEIELFRERVADLADEIDK